MYAHPDDESFGVAGTAMKLVAAGHTTALLTLTRGDAGMWFGKERGSWTPAELAAERSKEWREAVKLIGFRHSRLFACTFRPERAGSEHDDHRAASFYAARRLFFGASPICDRDARAPDPGDLLA